VRDGLRLLLRENCPLPEALRRIDAALRERDELPFCTVALVGLTPHGAALSAELCLAGHPLPVLLEASGTVRLVGQPGPLLGVLEDQFHITPSHATLEPGDALVLYTDGVTERRAGDREFGEQLLLPTLAACAGRTAAEIAARLEAAARSFVSTPLRDDLAVLVARAAGTPLSVPDPRAGGRAARGPAGDPGRNRVA
jgi:serine phosphatase RsbU (regulator of sigma subunit)